MELTQRDLIDLAIYAQYKDELYHHGILGMKWGVRRYQNEDGSLTPEGQRRYRETSEAERIRNTNTYMNTLSGVFNLGPIGGSAIGLATHYLGKKATDDDVVKQEEELKQAGKKGRQSLGSWSGLTTGAYAGMVPGALIGNPIVMSGGAIVGGILGGIGGYKLGGVSYDAHYDKNKEKNRYVKRTKKELEEYDREHQQG